MEKVSINLWHERHNHRLLGLSLYGYEGTKELQRVILLIEGTLYENLPSARLYRGKAVRELFREGREQEELRHPEGL